MPKLNLQRNNSYLSKIHQCVLQKVLKADIYAKERHEEYKGEACYIPWQIDKIFERLLKNLSNVVFFSLNFRS